MKRYLKKMQHLNVKLISMEINMNIVKDYLKNGIVVYHGNNIDFCHAAGFGCICDYCNDVMGTTYYYPILGKGVCPSCHQKIKARQEPKPLHPTDKEFQKEQELAFDRMLARAKVYEQI